MPVDKVINPGVAANIYAKTSNVGQKQAGGGEDAISFPEFLRQSVTQSIDTIKEGEKTSALAVTGKADITDVVQAATAAELTLETVVVLRDRMISAYQSIMQMPI